MRDPTQKRLLQQIKKNAKLRRLVAKTGDTFVRPASYARVRKLAKRFYSKPVDKVS